MQVERLACGTPTEAESKTSPNLETLACGTPTQAETRTRHGEGKFRHKRTLAPTVGAKKSFLLCINTSLNLENMRNTKLIIVISYILASCSTPSTQEPVSSKPQPTNIELAETAPRYTETKIIPPEGCKQVIEVLESKTVYDEEFKIYVYLKLKNNSKYSVIGISVEITPDAQWTLNQQCKIERQFVVKIAPNHIGILKQKLIPNDNDLCTTEIYDDAELYVDAAVYSNGMKIPVIDHQFVNKNHELVRTNLLGVPY